MRSLLIVVLALSLATMASVAKASALPASPAPAGLFESARSAPYPLIAPRPPQDSLDAWSARALALRSRPTEPLDATGIVDTATTHVRFDMPRVLSVPATDWPPVLQSVIVDLDGNGAPDVAGASPIISGVILYMNAAADQAPLGVLVGLPGAPYGLATGDIDLDGNADLVCSLWENDAIAVLLGNGDGTFRAKAIYGTGRGARGLALVDLDGDGDLDVAVACASDTTVSVLLNLGDGAFGAVIAIAAAAEPTSVIAADLNGDGRADLVTTNTYAASVSCFLNRGSGIFAAPITTQAPGYPYAVAAADLDDDGRLDVVMSGGGAGALLLGDGLGGFTADTSFIAPGAWYIAGVTIADLDGDGRPDIAMAEEGLRASSVSRFGAVRLYRGIGAGRFERLAGAYRTMDGLQSLTRGDVNLDGTQDILAAGSDNTTHGRPGENEGIALLLNRGGGRLSSLTEYAAGKRSGDSFTAVHSARGIHLAGALDDILVGGGDELSLMVNRAALGFSAPVRVGRGHLCAFRDLDHDGSDDVLLQRADTIVVQRGLPTHELETPRRLVTERWFVALGDFNADGIPDLVVRDASGVLYLARGDGVGGFAVPLPTGVVIRLRGDSRLPALAGNGVDLDRDGVDELVLFREQDGASGGPGESLPDTLDVYHPSPSGLFAARAHIPVPSPPNDYHLQGTPNQILPADFDEDGWPDLFAMRQADGGCCAVGSYAVLMNHGQGDLVVTEIGWPQRAEGSEAAIVDLNGDLRDDVLISIINSNDTGALGWLISKGDGTFASGYRNDLGDFINSVGVGNFDGDARPDVTITSGRDICLDVLMNATPWQDFHTPVLASLVSASIEAGTAHLAWRVDDASAEAIVLRSDGGATWAERARLRPAGDGSVRFDDAGLAPGAHVGYRLALLERGALVTASETWLDVPAAAQLALVGASPNPVAGDLNVAFSLAERTRGTLALFDLAGRRLAEHDLSALAAGEHRVRLASAGTIAPGLYFIRLVTPQHTLTTRAIVVD